MMNELKQERKGFRSMIASSQFSNLQLVNLATWQLGNLATWQLSKLAIWQLGNLATWQFGNLAIAIWQLGILATHFQFCQFSTSATFKVGNF